MVSDPSCPKWQSLSLSYYLYLALLFELGVTFASTSLLSLSLAFMRFTRRKYETAYESIAAAAASQHSPLGTASNVGHLAPPPIPPAQQAQGQSLGHSSAMGHHFHHSPSSSSTSSSSATTHRSPSTMATSTISPHHSSHHGANHFEHHGHPFNSAAKVSSSSVPESQQGELVRNSASASLLAPPANASSGAYAGQHPMFAQNAAAFLHPGLPFYQSAYHAAAAAAAAQLQSSPTAATGPWSVGGGYAGFPNPADHFPPGFVASSPSLPTALNGANGAPKIWRSVDTEQLEAALSTTSEDGVECSNKQKSVESESGKKALKKEVDDHGESIDVCSEANQGNSRCSSNVSGGSSHGGDDECPARHEDDDSNERQTPPVTAVSEDSNHSLKGCKGEETGEHDDLESNHSSREQHSEAEEENRPSEGEDDVDVVSSDSEANHVPAKARSQKRPSSPFDSSTYPSKHRFSHGQLFHHNNHHNHNHRHHSTDFHFTHSLIARSDSVGSGTETTPVS